MPEQEEGKSRLVGRDLLGDLVEIVANPRKAIALGEPAELARRGAPAMAAVVGRVDGPAAPVISSARRS